MKFAILVFQAPPSIHLSAASVFEVEAVTMLPTALRNARCIHRGDDASAKAFADGLRAAGVTVKEAQCTAPGDPTNMVWLELRSAPPGDKPGDEFSSLRDQRFTTVTVTGERNAQHIVAGLVYHSQWFELMPLPDDQWEFKVRAENGDLLRAMVRKDALAPGSGR